MPNQLLLTYTQHDVVVKLLALLKGLLWLPLRHRLKAELSTLSLQGVYALGKVLSM